MTYEQNLAAPELLSTAEYIELTTRNAAFEAWRAGRASYHPSEVPADVPQITNDERSRFFPGIAAAMADQWGGWALEQEGIAA